HPPQPERPGEPNHRLTTCQHREEGNPNASTTPQGSGQLDGGHRYCGGHDPDEQIPNHQQGQDHRCTQHQPDADGCGKVASGTRRRRRGLRTVRGHTGFALALAGRHHSDLEKFSFLVLDQFIDLTDVAVREAVELLLSTRTFVLADLAVLDEPVDLLLHLAPDVAHGDLAFFTLLLGELGHLLAALLGHLRNHHSDDLAVVG